MSDDYAFPNLVPGFDFLQNLAKTAGMSMPSIGQWVAPTLNPEELEKRIEELRTVQFWLEQNAKMLGATIQALEVQRMTLSTLKTMNVQMHDLRESLSLPAAPAEKPKNDTKDGAPGIVDPMQWWGALTQQFTQLASAAIKEGATHMGTAHMGATPRKAAAAAAKPAEAAKTPSARTSAAKAPATKPRATKRRQTRKP